MNQQFDRRRFLAVASGTVAAGLLSTRTRSFAVDETNVAWHDVREWGVEGKGFGDTDKYFDRLPARAKGVVRDAVWGLSRHSAGMLTRFRTDAAEIWTEHTVTSSRLEMAHMPATGVSGLDLYAEDATGAARWVAVMKPTGQTTKGAIASGLAPGERVYSVYLPLYNGTESLKIGVPKGAAFTPIEPRTEQPLVFYGTSITHGACASRPGMPHPAILGRRLDRPVINLGFSGNGRMEAEVTALLTELDAAAYVIDCLPNMVAEQVAARTEPLVRTLRNARPETPIVLVEDRTYANTWIMPAKAERHAGSRRALRTAYEKLIAEGVAGLHYLPGDSLLGDDRDDTTDGSHPSDLGFQRQADAFEPVLRTVLS